MKIKSRNISKKQIVFGFCGGCGCSGDKLYQLDGWEKKDWLCRRCFVNELIEGEYVITPKNWKRNLNLKQSH